MIKNDAIMSKYPDYILISICIYIKCNKNTMWWYNIINTLI